MEDQKDSCREDCQICGGNHKRENCPLTPADAWYIACVILKMEREGKFKK